VSVGSPSYITTLALTAIVAVLLCAAARRRPGRWIVWANWALGVVLLATSAAWFWSTVDATRFAAATSLPFALCDVAALVAAAALFTRQMLLVELTYFWGLAGTIQALITPDLNRPFPTLVFFEYVLGHAAIVCGALFLVVGQGLLPRRHAVARVFVISLVYTAFVGAIDAVTGGNYMYLRKPPGEWTLLRLLGPWPWYIGSAAAVALVLFTLLDVPWWASRRRTSASVQLAGAWGDGTRRRSAPIVPASQTDARPAGTDQRGGGPAPAVQSEGALPAPAVRVTLSGQDPR
jgi:hypothetical integral membrane protein (TIGR02206 family)